MKGGVRVDITSRWEVWDYTQWMVVWELTCESWHHITMRSVRIYSMNGGVRVYITSRWEVWGYIQWMVVWEWTSHSMNGGVRVDITSWCEVWDYTQWMVVWEFTSHHNEKCETILNEWWCESLHHITMRSVRLYSMNGGVWVYTLVADRSVMAAWLLSFCVAMCVERCGLGTWSCKTHCNGCMDVTWALFWGKAGAGNLVLFRVKWLRPAMKGSSCVRRVRLGSNRARLVPPRCSAMSGCSCVRSSMRFLTLWLWSQCIMAAWSLSFCVAMCVERCGFRTWSCKTHCSGCMDVTWALFWGKAGAGNLVFFRVKWLRPAVKGSSCVRRVRLGSNRARLVPPRCCAMSGCSCVRSSMRFLDSLAADRSVLAAWKVAWRYGCMRNTIVCCSWTL